MPARRREQFVVRMSPVDRVQVTFDRENQEVAQFSVQYLAEIDGHWYPIVRWDTAHHHSHMDISLPDGTQETREWTYDNYAQALTAALSHVRERWAFYRERYERWKNESR
jgi:hypothetical protein